ncbi:hypothetical protein HHI36_006523 [Cryptolaemus montrouzieri]|uniref:Uncharacterized protein n=1 Tax=Cryptolaemus montrouzieri TaxID=559131 RepID=A0ABD2NYE2_9CUCU
MIRRIYFELIMDKKTPISRVPVYNLYKDVVRYQGSSGAFLTLLKKIGFRLGRMTSGQMYLAEQHKIKKSRLDYLFSMKKIRDEKCNIIYLSAVNLLPYVPNWNSHKKLKENLNIPLNELRVARAVEFEVITAMDEARLISGNCLLFVSYNLNGKIKYHISFSQFTKWMSTNVLPKVSGNSVFVISHNLYKYFQGEKVPPLYSTRSQMEDWLSSHNIFFESNSLKTDLYDKILSVKDRYTTNLIDDFLIENKFRIISFPLHHCDLSPVETLLALFKIRFEESKETCSKVAELVTIFLDFLKTFLQDKWVASCENAKKYEEFFLSRESLIDNIIDEYISNKIFCREANEDTSSDDSSSNEN